AMPVSRAISAFSSAWFRLTASGSSSTNKPRLKLAYVPSLTPPCRVLTKACTPGGRGHSGRRRSDSAIGAGVVCREGIEQALEIFGQGTFPAHIFAGARMHEAERTGVQCLALKTLQRFQQFGRSTFRNT